MLLMWIVVPVSNAALRGTDAATQARIWQWASWADSELLPASCAWVFPYLGIMQFNKQVLILLSMFCFYFTIYNLLIVLYNGVGHLGQHP